MTLENHPRLDGVLVHLRDERRDAVELLFRTDESVEGDEGIVAVGPPGTPAPEPTVVDGDVLRADVSLSQREARAGLVLSLNVPVRVTCLHCGGRGESWTEQCHLCHGSGEYVMQHPVRVSVPPRVADGARFRFRVKTPDASSVRVEVRVAIRSSAA